MFVVSFRSHHTLQEHHLSTKNGAELFGIKRTALRARAALHNGVTEVFEFRPINYQTTFHIKAGKILSDV